MPDVYGTARGRVRARLASPLAARARARRHERFFALACLEPGMRVVDVGCGALGLRGLEPELDITGVDLAPRPDYPGPFVQADATERLPFDDGAFDLAYSSSVIEHVDARAARGLRGRDPARGARAGSCRRRRGRSRSSPTRCCPSPTGCRPALRRPYWRLGAAGAWEDIALLRRAELVELFGEPVHAERLGGPGQELDRAGRRGLLEKLIHSPHPCE